MVTYQMENFSRQVLRLKMVGNNLKETVAQLQQIVDKTVINSDTDDDGKIS